MNRIKDNRTRSQNTSFCFDKRSKKNILNILHVPLVKNLCWFLLFSFLLVTIDFVIGGPVGAVPALFILSALYFACSADDRMLIRLALAASLVRIVFTAVSFYIASQHTTWVLRNKCICAAAVLAVTPDQLEAQIAHVIERARKSLPQGEGVDPFTGTPFQKDSAGQPYSIGPDCADDGGRLIYDPSNGIVSGGDVTLLTKPLLGRRD